jgi:hypothetical protein
MDVHALTTTRFSVFAEETSCLPMSLLLRGPSFVQVLLKTADVILLVEGKVDRWLGTTNMNQVLLAISRVVARVELQSDS